jgi:hypothetical protein
MVAASCLSFGVECGTLFKGAGAVLMGFILFVGSVYLLLSAVFGRWMGYLVLVLAFSGWMLIHSTLWLTGFFISQGLPTPTNLGPRGQEPAWQVLHAGEKAESDRYSAFERYPNQPFFTPDTNDEKLAASMQSVSGLATDFLADHANEELNRDPLAANAISSSQFTVDTISFGRAEDGHTNLAVVEAHFTAGGPQIVISMYHDSGSVPRYSYMFLAGSLILFGIHLPLLDRAEKKRKEFLIGGTAPAWYGPN